MRVGELAGRRVAVWGVGREGQATIRFLRRRLPDLPLTVLDDAADPPQAAGLAPDLTRAFGRDRIPAALDGVDVVVKSPGVSLYREEVRSARARGVAVTSLVNLWFAEEPRLTTVCITGTKGKSTTASLLAHILCGVGRRVTLAGNIGVPVTDVDTGSADVAVIEVSSYQAADFDGTCDTAVLTSLFPEHLDWHLSVDAYYRDKLNLLHHARRRIANADARVAGADPYNTATALHARGRAIFDGETRIGEVPDGYLARPHNAANLCAALSVCRCLGVGEADALAASCDFAPLPHRQQELGEVEGVLFVDDSIATTPEATIAALSVYRDRDVTLIVGGYDRGIDYARLVERCADGAVKTLICMGVSGARIHDEARTLAPDGRCDLYRARSMSDAVRYAKQVTPAGGVVLLSPAAPSYGEYRDFTERGRDFAANAARS